jgi:hypothetical protein
MRLLRVIRARPRLWIAALLALAVGVLLPQSVAAHFLTRALITWNVGTVLYVALAAVMMARSTAAQMRHRAKLQDDGKVLILILVAITSVASLAAIAGELSIIKDSQGWLRIARFALAGLTVASSWAFIQTMFAMHYAHDYYLDLEHGRAPSLVFPDEGQRDYGDFFYVAAIIGTSGQTADVSFASPAMRRLGTLHCVLAYLFNTIVLALLINISASLL